MVEITPALLNRIQILLDIPEQDRWAFEPVGGGSIHSCWKLTFRDGRRVFCKGADKSDRSMLESEWTGLESLRKTGTVRVPEVWGLAEADEGIFLLSEWMDHSDSKKGSMASLGQSLARLHVSPATVSQFGFDSDNFLGKSRQLNGWDDSWINFFVSRRLQPQIRWAFDRERIDGRFLANAEQLISRLDKWLIEPPFASLLHGDLWSGNYLFGRDGTAVLIDPAVYWGHHEADLGMLTWMGGVTHDFWEAYDGALTPEDGRRDRVAFYRWYHQLNHLNLFGSGYLPDCQQVFLNYL